MVGKRIQINTCEHVSGLKSMVWVSLEPSILPEAAAAERTPKGTRSCQDLGLRA